MSNEKETESKTKIDEATETIKGLFANLVPVDQVEITDIFGVKHTIATSISARTQIKLLRLIEKVKDVNFDFSFNEEDINILDLLLSLANNEQFLTTLGECFDLAYPILVHDLKEQAKQNGLDCEDALDLFPIEDVVGAIAPLFIRLAKKTLGALQNVTS